MKKLITIGIIIIFVLVGVVSIFMMPNKVSVRTSSDKEILQAITRDIPSYLLADEPIIALESVSRHDGGWYIATIKSLQQKESFVPVKIILVDHTIENQLPYVILGPDTYFTESELLRINTPDSVIEELRKT